jgi:hypothetical protein
MTRQKKHSEDEAIRRMIGGHLRFRQQAISDLPTGSHLDEDKLAAFVEGCLSASESAPLISHLIACSFCRRATSQLIRLEAELGESEVVGWLPPEHGRIRRLLDSLAARVLPQSDEDAVFAYHAPAEDFERDEKAASAESKEQSPPPCETDAPPKS